MAKKRKDRLPAGIKELADGRYRIRATYVDPLSGARRDRTRTLSQGTGLVELVANLEKLRQELEGEAAKPAAVPRLKDWLDAWVERKRLTVTAKTAETYASSLAVLDADLGHVPLDELTRQHLVWWGDQLQEEVGDKALSTVQRWWRYGMSAIRDGLARYDLPDVTRRLEGPAGKTAPRRERRTLSRQEVERVVEALSGRYASLGAFLALTGCRFGEAAGLRWCDLELDDPSHARLVATKTEIVGGFQSSTTKSGSGRVVGLPPRLVETLKTHRAECPGVGEALVWRTSKGKPVRKVYVYRTFDSAAKALKLDIKLRPQVFRRTYNSLGLSLGLDKVLLQGLLGHAGDEMTAHYHGLRPETAARAAMEVWG